jgi:hypothetical protein
MKNAIFPYFILVAVLLTACKKEASKTSDFRDSFAGKYYVQKWYFSTTLGQTTEQTDSLIYVIDIVKSATDSGLVFNNDTLYLTYSDSLTHDFWSKNSSAQTTHVVKFIQPDSVYIVFGSSGGMPALPQVCAGWENDNLFS